MKYRAKSAKIQSDSNVLSDISKGTVRAANRAFPIFSPFIFLYDYIVSTLAFIARGFFRKKLGSRTFGLFTFLFLVLFTWLALYYRGCFLLSYQNLVESDSFFAQGVLGRLTGFSFAFFGAFFGMVIGIPYFFEPTEDTTWIFPEFSFPVEVLLGITFIIFFIHIREVKNRKKSNEIIHSQYRGDSILFNWLEGKIVLGRKMTPEKIWLLVEPSTVLLLALIIWGLTSWHSLAYILLLSGTCLFLEEYKVYKENKELEYNTIDQILDAKYYDYLQKVIQEKIKSSEQEFTQKKYRASFDEGDPRFGIKKSDPSGAKYRAKVT